MPANISPLSQVDPAAELGSNVTIGPFCLVGPGVKLGNGTHLDSHVVLTGNTEIGDNNRFLPHCVIGADPQDKSYEESDTRLLIGETTCSAKASQSIAVPKKRTGQLELAAATC